MENLAYSRSPELLGAATSRLLIVDLQERFTPVISDAERVIENCVKIVRAAHVLSIPVSATEQYPRGLGATVPELASLLPHRPEKLRFSSAEVLDWGSEGHQADGRHQVVLAGIETHICLLQTALDLLSAGFDVFVAADAVGARRPADHEIGLRRMADSGARLITIEMAMFEWCEIAGTPEFKEISKLATGR